MKTCEIISDFDIKNFRVIADNLPLDNVVFFTDSVMIKDEITKVGYKAVDLRYYVGYNNTRAAETNDRIIEKTERWHKFFDDVNYDGINIGNAFKLLAIRDIRLLEWTHEILKDYDNIIFLFRLQSWWHFCVIDIARKLGYESKFGVSQLSNSELIKIDFGNKWANRFEVVNELLKLNSMDSYQEDKTRSFSKTVKKIKLDKFGKPRFAFFIVNDASDFYAKSAWEILRQLKNKNEQFVIFTFFEDVDEQVLEKGFTPNNIEQLLSDLYPKFQMMKKNIHWLKYYFRLKRKLTYSKEKILNFYFKHLGDYKTIRIIAKAALLIGGPIVIIYKKILERLARRIEEGEDTIVGNISKIEASIIYNFFKRVTSITTNDLILESYLKYFLNDVKIRDIGKIMLKASFLNYIFKTWRLQSILVSADGSHNNDLVCQVAKINGILSFQLTPSHTIFTTIHTFFFTAEKLFAGGPKPKQQIINCGIEENRLIVTGEPKYDYLSKKHTKGTLQEKPNSKKLILIVNSRWRDGDEEWMSQLIHYCNEKNYDIVIRPHPAYSKAPQRIGEGKLRISRIEKRCKGLRFSFSVRGQLRDVLKNADIMITDFSTSGIETTLADVPIILANIGKDSLEWGTSYMEEGVVLHAETLEELYKCINDVLHDKDTKHRLEKARKEFCYNFNFLNDGRATERIIDSLNGKEISSIEIKNN